ncbi:MAG TPA: LOG family protein, partial [Nitrosopumilaceae archaeon]|nr:LOG family protein [Nitrosopumilaceae archaeon]
RKMKMMALSDGFITLPGGLGSMEELFEVFTWRILGQHKKPLGILNVDSFYQHLLNMLDYMVTSGFVKAESMELLSVHHSPEGLLKLMQQKREPIS